MEDTFKVRDLRHKQFFMVDDAYLNGYAKFCGINATGVYCSLCRHASKDQVCFPSKKLIAEELNISERYVYTAIKILESFGIIRISQKTRRENGKFHSLTYVLADKSRWKSKPSAIPAVGNKQHLPSANNDTNQRHQLPSKGTHIRKHKEGITSKGVETKKQEINDLLKKLHLSKKI